MELRQLKYFVAVAEELHFGRAAARLHIATSPLSQQIKQLERELKFPLFVRSTRAVTLTAGGEALLPRARNLLRDAKAAVDDAARHHAGRVGSLNVGYAGFSTSTLIPEISRAFHARYPGVSVRVRGELLSVAQHDAILAGNLDIGFLRPFNNDDERIQSRPLFAEEVVIALPAHHRLAQRPGNPPLSPAELEGESLITYENCPTMKSVLQQITAESGLTPLVAERAADTYSVVSLVAAGLGVAFVPAGIMGFGLDGVTFAHLTESDRIEVPLCIAWRTDSANPRAVDHYLGVVDQVVHTAPLTA